MDIVGWSLLRGSAGPIWPFWFSIAGSRPDRGSGLGRNTTLNQKDGIQPNLDGVNRIVTTMLPAVEAFLRKIETGKAG